MSTAPRYAVDPADPRAPPQDVWDALSEAERARVVESLPVDLPVSESAPPEGDVHFDAKVLVRDVLRRYFGRRRRRVYVGNGLPVYCPDERLFAPDVLVVVDVDPHPRDCWVVSEEGRGLDLVIEIHVAGRRAKDVRENVIRYARLGIREYFVFEVRRSRLLAYRLQAGRAAYQPIVPQGGLYASEVLGLEIAVEGERLRFFHDLAPLPDATELITRLERATDELTDKRDAAERRAEEEARRAEDESRRAEESERRLAEALAELARLKGEPH